MASFTAGTTFVDGVSNDVTAAKLGALVTNATPTSGFIQDRTAETVIATNDTLLIGDASDSNNLKRMTVANFAQTLPTAKVTTGTIETGTFGTTTSTAATITTGTIPTLVATTLVTTGTGTAASPAIVPTGDTNTGIFFPAADTIAFSEGGAESMRIDSSGNVGIGTSSPAHKLQVSGIISSNDTVQTTNGTTVTIMSVAGTGEGIVGTSSNHALQFRTNNTERLRIDSSGNVGIGTASPNIAYRASLTGDGSTIVGGLALSSSSNVTYIGTTGASAADFEIFHVANGYMRFATNNTERLRITSGGEVYIAGTTDQGAYNLQVNGTGVWGAGAYVNGSDSRIKEDIQPIASGLDVVDKLNPVTYKYKETWSSDQSIQSGFIAQELLTALDGQIYVDGVVQQGGTEGYYSVAYQNLIPILAKAIQELSAKVTALEAA